MKAVTVIGMGDDGCVGLTARATNAVAAADVLAGGERQLAFFPQFRGERVVLKEKLGEAIDRIAGLAHEHTVAVLASGDPLFFGVGALIVKKVGAEHVEILPAPSSMQLAFARAGLKWDDAAVVSLHGRSREGLLTRLRRHRKVAILTDDESSPRWIAQHLSLHDQLGWRAWVCESLGGADERVRSFTIEELAACEDIGPLNVLLLERQDGWQPPPAISFVHEDDFAKRMPKKGLITKRETRCLSLAMLQLRPDSVVWDVGAGSGSVAIEAALLAYEGRVFAVEIDPEGVEICRDNVRTHAADNVRVVAGRAPEALAELPDPDAVFVGGSKGSMAEIVDVALARLKPGGRLVVNAITLDNVGEAYTCLRASGREPEVVMLNVSRAEPLARYMRWEAQNPIHIFCVTK
ncbi:MAG TPA: precorrin-6y C5,15-methyltransferase (decarboxylating) subunit CbiE [Polyangia bacterium]